MGNFYLVLRKGFSYKKDPKDKIFKCQLLLLNRCYFEVFGKEMYPEEADKELEENIQRVAEELTSRNLLPLCNLEMSLMLKFEVFSGEY